MSFLFCSCSFSESTDTKQTSATKHDQYPEKSLKSRVPNNFNVISKEEELNIPDLNGLNTVLLEALEKIGVEKILYKEFGNYSDQDLWLELNAFVVTNTDKCLYVDLRYFKLSKPWSWECSIIKNSNNIDIIYYAPDIEEVVNLYDYNTDELVSPKSMTHEEFDKKIQEEEQKKVDESDKEIQRATERLYKEWNLK